MRSEGRALGRKSTPYEWMKTVSIAMQGREEVIAHDMGKSVSVCSLVTSLTPPKTYRKEKSKAKTVWLTRDLEMAAL